MASRILIADDNYFIRAGLKRMLEGMGDWEVCGEASDGYDAVRKVGELSPDLVILDFRMPGLNGLEAAKEIRSQNPRTHLLLCTMYLSPQLTHQAKVTGVEGTIAKTDLACMRHAIEALLRNETFFSTSN